VDLFPHKENLSRRTYSGGIVSIICFIIVVYLFYVQLSSFLQTTIDNDLVVDVYRQDNMKINFDISFHKLPCAFVSVDALDVAGNEHLDIEATIQKQRLDRRGKKITEAESAKLQSEVMKDIVQQAVPKNGRGCETCYGAESDEYPCCPTCESVRNAYRHRGWAFNSATNIAQCNNEGFVPMITSQRNEGCRLTGEILVDKVAGNFHFSPGKSFSNAHNHAHTTFELGEDKFNMSHTIHALSFGEPFPGAINPLDGLEQTTEDALSAYQYYIKVVSTSFTDIYGQTLNSSQFSVTQHYLPIDNSVGSGHESHGAPGVFFLYDLSPIQVNLVERQKSLSSFVTIICAIIGGAFTVFRIIDEVIYQGLRSIRKKQELGKAF